MPNIFDFLLGSDDDNKRKRVNRRGRAVGPRVVKGQVVGGGLNPFTASPKLGVDPIDSTARTVNTSPTTTSRAVGPRVVSGQVMGGGVGPASNLKGLGVDAIDSTAKSVKGGPLSIFGGGGGKVPAVVSRAGTAAARMNPLVQAGIISSALGQQIAGQRIDPTFLGADATLSGFDTAEDVPSGDLALGLTRGVSPEEIMMAQAPEGLGGLFDFMPSGVAGQAAPSFDPANAGVPATTGEVIAPGTLEAQFKAGQEDLSLSTSYPPGVDSDYLTEHLQRIPNASPQSAFTADLGGGQTIGVDAQGRTMPTRTPSPEASKALQGRVQRLLEEGPPSADSKLREQAGVSESVWSNLSPSTKSGLVVAGIAAAASAMGANQEFLQDLGTGYNQGQQLQNQSRSLDIQEQLGLAQAENARLKAEQDAKKAAAEAAEPNPSAEKLVMEQLTPIVDRLVSGTFLGFGGDYEQSKEEIVNAMSSLLKSKGALGAPLTEPVVEGLIKSLIETGHLTPK